MEVLPEIEELIAAISQGKESAFKMLFDQYKHRVYATAFAFTENKADAEEVVQEVFLRVWKGREKLPEITLFSAWLHTVTRNRCLTALKKKAIEQQRRIEISTNLPISTEDTDANIQEKEMQTLLHTALTRLSPQQRKVFIMSRLQGLDRKTIAKKLELAPATVSVHLTIALKSMKRYLMNDHNNIAGVILLSLILDLHY